MNNDDLIDKRVKIMYITTKAYVTQGLIGKYGTVKKIKR